MWTENSIADTWCKYFSLYFENKIMFVNTLYFNEYEEFNYFLKGKHHAQIVLQYLIRACLFYLIYTSLRIITNRLVTTNIQAKYFQIVTFFPKSADKFITRSSENYMRSLYIE